MPPDQLREHERKCWADDPNAWIARLIARIDAERARAEKAEAQNARMREVLLRAGGTDCEGFCIDCGNEPRDRHDKACIVAELLREK